MSQRSLAWYAAAAIEHYALVPEDRVLQFSSISFDNSVEEIFPCLARGATLLLRTDEMIASTAELFRRCREGSVTAMSPPTAFWHEMAAAVAAEPEILPESLRILCVGGERMLPESLAGRRRAVGRKARLFNTYGPTEATVVATLCELTGEEGAISQGDPPIGRPVPNARVAIVDASLQPVPAGVAGELCLGGDGVARGYLGRPEVTAERFVPDPHFGDPRGRTGRRLYRTGDLARHLADGNLEFLGRMDHQVKIRGFRVEPGEIEALLLQQPGVREAAVTVNDERLIAYAAAAPEVSLSAAQLRRDLAVALPDYMVPSSFVLLDELPLGPSGKIDRRALPAPADEADAGDQGYVPPGNEIEEVVAEIFAEVLDRRRAGIYDDFFALGGHSLLATRVISRVRDACEVELPVRDFFAAPTIAGIAAVIGKLLNAESGGLSEIPRRPQGEPVPLSFAQERLWFLEQLAPGMVAYNIPFPMRLRGPIEPAVLAASLAAIRRRHEVLRATFQAVAGNPPFVPLRGNPTMTIAPLSPGFLPLVDLTPLPAAVRRREAARLVDADRRRPFDLARGDLLRAALLKLGSEDHLVTFSAH
ncbi:MAG: AMP-binding protein, partial [bacterium]|nr:AMP-binding protein [bacterium]